MRQVVVHRFEDWRAEARELLGGGVPPADVMFREHPGLLPVDHPLAAAQRVSAIPGAGICCTAFCTG